MGCGSPLIINPPYINYTSTNIKVHWSAYDSPKIMLYCQTLPYLEFSVRQFGCVFLPQQETRVSFLRTVGVGGGGGRQGLWERSWKCDIEVPRNQVCVVTKLLFIFYRRACMQLIQIKFREKQKFMGMYILSNGLIST